MRIMPIKPPFDEEITRFIASLADTLDLDKTIKTLGLTKDHARGILQRLCPLSPAAHKHLSEQTSAPKIPAHSAHKEIYVINVDGASRGNPGLAGAGAVIKDHEGRIIRKLKKFLGSATNNTAEYQALIMALEAAREMNLASIRVFADSELMVKQINGVYKVKSPDLKPLYDKAVALIKGFQTVRLSHVFREQNGLADEMANEAIDTRGDR